MASECSWCMIATMRVEIGGGTIPRPGYTNFDPTATDSAWRGRLGYDPIPVGDGTVETVYASHVMEHIPIVDDRRIAAMNEVWRVLIPGGLFEIILPVVGYTDHAGDGLPHYAGWQAWSDPGHASHWFYPESFWYFTGGPAGNFRANADYGIKYWESVEERLVDGWEAHVTLRKPS